jgi:hypothetical protein
MAPLLEPAFSREAQVLFSEVPQRLKGEPAREESGERCFEKRERNANSTGGADPPAEEIAAPHCSRTLDEDEEQA